MRDHDVGEERDEAEQLAQPVAVVELAHSDCARQEGDADVEEREHQRLGRAADIAELAPLGEEEAVEEHLEDEEAQQHADLQGQVPAGRPARGALELVAAAKVVALDLDVAQMAAQAVQLVAPLRGLGAELAHCRRRRLADGREPALEVEAGQPFLVEVKLVEQDAVGAVLLGLDALYDQALDVVEDGGVGRRLLLGAALGPELSHLEVGGELGDVQRRENVERGAVVVLLPFEATDQAGECRAYCQFLDPMSQSGCRPLQPRKPHATPEI